MDDGTVLEFTVLPEEAGIKLSSFLRRREVSVSLLRHVKYQPGGLLCNSRPVRTNALVRQGDIVTLTLETEENRTPPQDVPLSIVYESGHALVVDKPHGLVMHPTPTHREKTLANGFANLMAQRGWGRRFRPLGRLDADTSGLVLLAMNAYAAPVMAKSVQKTYVALARGMLPLGAGRMEAPLGAVQGSSVLQEVCPDGKPSVTEYEVVAAANGISVALVKPLTGRTHQIRVHFAHLGHPLLGDTLYGDGGGMERHALHCTALRFCEPGGRQVKLKSPLPADMQQALQKALPAAQLKLIFSD